jgi:hypothetical protein
MIVLDRNEIVKRVLEVDGQDATDEKVEQAMQTWWENSRQTGGLGLSVIGDQSFRQAGLTYNDYHMGPANYLSNVGSIIRLNRKMISPYYLYFASSQKYIRIYDSRIAVLITLYGGINNYLESLLDRGN